VKIEYIIINRHFKLQKSVAKTAARSTT